MKIPSFLLEVLYFCERFKVLYFSFTALNILYFLSVFLEIFLFLSLFSTSHLIRIGCVHFSLSTQLSYFTCDKIWFIVYGFLFYSILLFFISFSRSWRRWASIFCAVFFFFHPHGFIVNWIIENTHTAWVDWEKSALHSGIFLAQYHPKCCVSTTPQLSFVLVLLRIHWISPSVNKLSHCHRRWIFHLPLLEFDSSASCMARGSERAKEKNQRLTTSNM